MTGNTNKARAVFLAALMVFSVFAGTIALSGSAAAEPEDFEGGAVHYENISSSVASENKSIIEVPFSGPIDSASIDEDNFTVLDDGDSVSDQINYTRSAEKHDGSGNVELIVDDGELINSQDLEVDLSSDVANNPGEKTVAFAGQTIALNGSTGQPDASGNFTTFQGTIVAFQDVDNPSESPISGFTVEDDEDDFNFFQQFSPGTNSTVFFLDTGDRELGDYELNNSDQFLTVRELGLGVEVDDLNVTIGDNIEGDVTSRASGQPIEIELVDEAGDGDTVRTIGTTTTGQGDFDFSFSSSSLDEGDYVVEVTENSSGVTAQSSTIELTESDSDASFVDSTISDQRGDIVEMTVEMEDTDFATITVGEADGSEGVVANVTVEDENDDDQATVYLNTFRLENQGTNQASGQTPFAVDDDSDDSISQSDVSDNVSDLIDAGEYDLEIVAGETPAVATTSGADGVATLVLEERSTDTLRMWTGSAGELNPSDLEDVNEAIENGEITQSSDIAVGDLAVHQLVASGFEGALDARENEEVTNEFLGLTQSGPIDLTIEESDPGANQDESELNLGGQNVTVIADGPNDTYFVVVETGNVNLDAPRNEPLPSDDDTELEANFTVLQDDAGFDFTPDGEFDDDENSETFVQFTAEEPEVNIDEPFNVSQAEAQTVSGNTNIAPGTELQLRVRSQDGVSPSFLKTSSPVVQSDGTFSSTFDFSEQNVGDEYDIIVSDTLLASNEEEEGTVVEGVSTDTATPEPGTDTPEPDTDTPEPDTDTPEPDTDTPEPDTATPEPDTEEPTSTPTSTPGFGVVVALTALLAAALLAIRRD